MAVNGYCSECDSQFELSKRTVFQVLGDDGKVYYCIECPRCEQSEEFEE